MIAILTNRVIRAMIKRFVFLLGVCLPCYTLAMLTPDEMIAQADESFSQGHYDTAVAYYSRAAERGNRTAQLQLSLWYFSGKTSAPNLKLGQFWLDEALKPRTISEADLVGVSYMASFYQSGIDSDLAVAWLLQGAQQGDAQASYLLLQWYAGVLRSGDLSSLVFEWLNTQ